MDLTKNIDEYRKNGWTKVEGFFSVQELSEIKSEVEKYISDRKTKLSGRDINFTENDLNSIHKLWEEGEENFFYNISHSDRLTQLVEPFLDDKAEVRCSELFLKPAKEGMPSPSHQDDFYWCIEDSNALTVWTALVPAGPENGGIYYYNGTHKLGLVPHVDSFSPGSSQKVESEPNIVDHEKVIPSLNPGDILIHHALTIHGSAKNESDKSRRGWTIQYKGASSRYDQERKKHYLQRLKMQIEQRGQSK